MQVKDSFRDHSRRPGVAPSPQKSRLHRTRTKRRVIRGTQAERANDRPKNEFDANAIWVRVHAKAISHLMCVLLMLSADQLTRLFA